MEKNAAPIAWSQLLADAIAKPGMMSQAYSMFHNYSIGNMLLAMGQCKARGLAIGPIATFKRWQALGRCVQKGQKALVLCMPVSFKKDAEKEDGKRFVCFTYKPRWFALSQTEGADYVAKVPTMAWDCLAAEIKLNISEVAFTYPDGNCMGFAMKRTYAINPVNPMPHKTRFHELAHIVLGHTETEDCHDVEALDRSTREVEAESVAMILCETLGLPGVEYSRGYIQHWLGTGKTIDDKTAQRIFSAAEKILRAGLPKVEAETEVEAEATA